VVGPAEHLLSSALTVARSRLRFRSSPLENWGALCKDLVDTLTIVACPTWPGELARDEQKAPGPFGEYYYVTLEICMYAHEWYHKPSSVSAKLIWIWYGKTCFKGS
jgi:hypothetical protein